MRQKLQIRFAKEGDLRFISHHDLMRLFERVCRRAALPIRMSEGFNPRPRLSFPLSLAVGVEGREEVMELQLDEWMAPADVKRRIEAWMPAGLTLNSVTVVDPQKTAEVTEVSYRVEHTAIGRLTAGDVEQFLARREVPVTRTRKGRSVTVDIRPYVRRAALTMARSSGAPSGGAGGEPALHLDVIVTPTGTARPDEVLAALGLDIGAAPDEEERSAPPSAAPATGGSADAEATAAPRIVRERVLTRGTE